MYAPAAEIRATVPARSVDRAGLAVLCLGLCVWTASVSAETTVQGTLAVKSGAFYRGFELVADHRPVLQGQLEVRLASGLYAGVWASRVDFDSDDRRYEADYLLGYQKRWRPWLATDVTLQRYTFDARVHGRRYEWNELQLAAHLGERWTLLVAEGDNWAARGRHTRIAEITYRHPLPRRVTAFANAGRHFADGVLADDFTYLEAGAGWALGAYQLQVVWVDVLGHRNPWRTVDNRWLVSIARQFSARF